MIYILIAATVFAGDMMIKNYMEKTRKMHAEKPVWKGKAVVRFYHNRGAFLNLGEKNSPLMRILSVCLTAVILVVFAGTLTKKGSRLLKAGLSLLLGGAFSNTYDRLHRKYVVDYLSFCTGIRAVDRVVFNLADFAIMIGALFAAFGA